MGKCYIFGAGSFYGLRSRPEAGDLVIAADGGYAYCRASGVVPDLVIGDFDSLGEVPAGENVVRLPVEKDDTDTLAAIRLGLDRGFRDSASTAAPSATGRNTPWPTSSVCCS